MRNVVLLVTLGPKVLTKGASWRDVVHLIATFEKTREKNKDHFWRCCSQGAMEDYPVFSTLASLL